MSHITVLFFNSVHNFQHEYQSLKIVGQLLSAQHSRSLSYYDRGFSIIGYIETPCYDQYSQTPRHCMLSSKLASPSGLYEFLTRSTGLFGPTGLSQASYRPPPGPVRSRKTDCTGVPKSVHHPHGPVTGARMSTLRDTRFCDHVPKRYHDCL